MSEAELRDLLTSNLSILEDGLELLGIEHFIPSELGTRSFIDLLAKDRRNHWVIIEVKKTNAAAREAAHEIFKYVESVKGHLGARDDEIRMIVASEKWDELLVPFSRLKAEVSISVEGFILALDDAGTLTAARVEALPLSKGRYLAPWHELNLYHDVSSLQKGISSYDDCCKNKGINDYVLVVLKASTGHDERVAEFNKLMSENLYAVLGMNESENTHPHEPQADSYEYILYFAPQILSKEFCLKLLARDPERLDEIQDCTVDKSDDERLCELHEAVDDLDPRPFRDWFEIGYPAKFRSKLLEDEGWSIERVIRRGLFARNTLLTDDSILDEIKGLTGSSKCAFIRNNYVVTPPRILSLRKDVSEALAGNERWLYQIGYILDVISKDETVAELDIEIFNPSAGVFTLYFLATETNPKAYTPRYVIVAKSGDGKTKMVYLGMLFPAGTPMSFKKIIDNYYNDKIRNLMLLASTGYRETRDTEILDDLGLVYKSYLIDGPNWDGKWYEFNEGCWKAFTPHFPFEPLRTYFDNNPKLIQSIVNEIGQRMHNGFWVTD